MIDRANACPVIIASPQGGMGIEEIDKKYILTEKGSMDGFTESQIEKIAMFLEPSCKEEETQLENVIRNLFKAFKENDATLVEINPLGIDTEGKVILCDSKVNIDDNAKPRRTKIFDQEDLS